jgi:hypothetical protein
MATFTVRGLTTFSSCRACPISASTPWSTPSTNFLHDSTFDGSTTIEVDRDGRANGIAFVDMAVLQGVGTDVNGLLNNGAPVLD